VLFRSNETLATTYEKLQSAIQGLFKCHWAKIKTGECKAHKQKGKGSIHKLKDKECLSHLLSDGWNTQVSLLEGYAAEIQTNAQF
jgi:methionyl-tRNA formyltransferase